MEKLLENLARFNRIYHNQASENIVSLEADDTKSIDIENLLFKAKFIKEI